MDYFIARMSADKVSPGADWNPGDHMEFDISGVSGGIATLSTGVGQANGLITIDVAGIYLLKYCWGSVRRGGVQGRMYMRAVFHPSNADVTDRMGVSMRTYSDTDFGASDTPNANIASICEFAQGDIIKFDVESIEQAIDTFRARNCVAALWKLA